MYKFLLLFILALFIFGCAANNNISKTDLNDSTNVKKVTIKSGGNSTIYKVNKENLIVSSSYVNRQGSTNTRSYSYGDNKELVSVVKNNSVTGSENIYISTVVDRSAGNKIKKKIKSKYNSRGTSEILTVEYYYDDDGKVIGMVQRDGNGNIIAKGINN
ncbi:MAG TPA: hypothetical protein PLO89_07850 [Spirochaetota bacterium]|nr:hypothetical protein [Spirochaetota bacterium]